MYKQFAGTDGLDRAELTEIAVTQSGRLDALVALDQIGARRTFAHDEEIYAEGDPADCWYRVVSGAVRICKLLPDGRRHIGEFCFTGDSFGLDSAGERVFAAEAIGDAVLMRFPRRMTERLLDTRPDLVRRLCDLTLRDLAHSQTRMLLLARMTASERVASFLIELSDRFDALRSVDVPMSRLDIADYLGLTIETVCRVLSAFKRQGLIAMSNPHRIELRDREGIVALCEG